MEENKGTCVMGWVMGGLGGEMIREVAKEDSFAYALNQDSFCLLVNIY